MRLLPLLALVLVAGAAASAQPALRASVVAGGAADATGDAWRVRATVGQAAATRVTRRQYVLTQGFWPAAASARPLLTLALTPEPSPLVVRSGGKFRFDARFTVPAGGPSAFQYWAQATYPGGTPVGVLGPITLLLTPPTTETVTLLQTVAADAPPGDHVYTMFAGTHPSEVLAQASFRYTAEAPPDHLPASMLATETGRTMTRAGAETRGAATRSAEATGPWLAHDVDGVLLLPGHVMDLRADSSAVAAKDSPNTMTPDASQATVVDLPAVATLGVPYPNPARAQTTVRFGLPAEGPVRLTVYDALGRRVADLADGTLAAGWHTATLATAGLAGGVYLVRLDAGDRSLTQRLTVTR